MRVLSLGDMIDDEGRQLVEVEMERSLLKDEGPVHGQIEERQGDGWCLHLGRSTGLGSSCLGGQQRSPCGVLRAHKSTARTFKRKTLDFRLKVETKGLFKNKEEVIAEGKVPLSSLIAKCALRDRAKVTLPKQQRKQRRGEVTLELNLHHPIGQDGDGKEVTRAHHRPARGHGKPCSTGRAGAGQHRRLKLTQKIVGGSTPPGGAKPRSALRSGGGGGGGGGDTVCAAACKAKRRILRAQAVGANQSD